MPHLLQRNGTNARAGQPHLSLPAEICDARGTWTGGGRTVQQSCLILVVDDDPSIRATVTEILELELYPVRTAPNGAAALRVVNEEPPALVLLDMRMPVMDGWAFARALRDRGDSTPIVMMTAAQDAQMWA